MFSLPSLIITIKSLPSLDHGINFVAFPFLSQDLGLNFVSQGFSVYHSLKIVVMNWVSFFFLPQLNEVPLNGRTMPMGYQ